jgi:hypothetical protein
VNKEEVKDAVREVLSELRTERLPGQYAIYKKMGAAQFNLITPRYKDFTRRDGTTAERIDKDGSVLLEVAPGVGKRQYDWKDSKISFSIGMSDLAIWMANPYAEGESGISLFHDTPNSPEKKKLIVRPGQRDGYMLSLTETTQNKTVTVPLSDGEYEVLLRLLMAAAPTFIGWL